MEQAVIWGMALGLAFVATPGPINVLTLRRAITHGFHSALYIQLSASIGDIVWVAVACFALPLLTTMSFVGPLIAFLGRLCLIWLIAQSVHQWWHGIHHRSSGEVSETLAVSATSSGTPWRSAVALSLLNPSTLAFWLSMGSSVTTHAHGNTVLFALFFIVGEIAWMVGFPWCISRFRHLAQPQMLPWVSLFSAVMLFAVLLGTGGLLDTHRQPILPTHRRQPTMMALLQ